jgi:hypothetical protein
VPALFFLTPLNEFFQIQAYLITDFVISIVGFAIFAGGKDTEVLMVKIDDHCKQHPLDNLYTCVYRKSDSAILVKKAAKDRS